MSTLVYVYPSPQPEVTVTRAEYILLRLLYDHVQAERAATKPVICSDAAQDAVENTDLVLNQLHQVRQP